MRRLRTSKYLPITGSLTCLVIKLSMERRSSELSGSLHVSCGLSKINTAE